MYCFLRRSDYPLYCAYIVGSFIPNTVKFRARWGVLYPRLTVSVTMLVSFDGYRLRQHETAVRTTIRASKPKPINDLLRVFAIEMLHKHGG